MTERDQNYQEKNGELQIHSEEIDGRIGVSEGGFKEGLVPDVISPVQEVGDGGSH